MTDLRAQLQAGLSGSYTLERELGRGGMATVFLAQDLKHDRPVALKVLHPELANSLGPDRFLREIKLAARLQHPHILTVLDSGETGARLWFTMPFIAGESLRQRLTRERQLTLGTALGIAREAARALDYAHHHGIIHRDIKPENILLTEDGTTLVADFGIARALDEGTEPGGERLTATGISIGTPAYMSPEQSVADRALDLRTDIYSLGAVLYEMLAGEPPFSGPNQQAILAKRLSEPVPHLSTLRDVPPAVERIVTRALARAPADRFASAGEFAAALDQATSGERAAPETVGLPAATRARRRRRAALAIYLLARPRPAAGAPPESAAVLPFLDLSPQHDQEYFSDGLTEELTASLSRVPGLRVAARSSAFRFKGRSPDVAEVGNRLHVGAVLEGSVRKSGNRLRVTAQLVSVKDGYQLWSDSYDRDLADVFAVQENIARAIVGALRVRLAGRPDSAFAPPTRDLAAYDAYLKGRFAWNQRTDTSLPEAVRYFEEAIVHDSNFAQAYAGLSDAYLLLPSYSGVSPGVAWPKAKAAALRALALDSNLAEAETSLAYGRMIHEWDWAAAEAGFHRAIRADSTYANAHHWYADFLAGRGRLNESLAEMQRAAELDPESGIISAEVGWVYYLMHRSDEAQAQIERLLARDQNFAHAHFVMGLIQIEQGRPRDAVASLRRAVELGGIYPHTAAALAFAYAASGDTAATKRMIDEFRRRAAHEYTPPLTFAVAYAALGDTAKGLDWLLRGVETHDIFMSENFFDPMLDPLRHGPRYRRVVEGMSLPR